MAHRIGVCRTCRARFQIPALFAHRNAKCRNCGGVVEIGPLQGEPEPSPAPATTRASPPGPAPAPRDISAPRFDPIAPGPIAPAPTASEPIAPEPAPRPARSPDRSQSPERKRTALVGGIVIVGIAVLLVLVLRSWLGRDAGPPPRAGASAAPAADSPPADASGPR